MKTMKAQQRAGAAKDRRSVKRTLATLTVAIAGSLAIQAPALADTTLVDQTLPGPLGGAQVCVARTCLPVVTGISNVRLSTVTRGTGIVLPVIVPSSAPGCGANVNLALRLLTPGIAITLRVALSFDRTDGNGSVIAGSHQTIEAQVPVDVASIGVPVASVCAAILR